MKAKAKAHLWEQRLHLGNLIAVLEDYKGKKEALELKNELKSIHDDLNAIKDAKDMDDAKFAAVSGKIFKLRNGYTG